MNEWQVTATKRQERKREWREEMRREKGIDTMRHIYESDERLLWRNGNRRGGLPESLFVHFLYWLVLGTVYGFRSLSLSLSLSLLRASAQYYLFSHLLSLSAPLTLCPLTYLLITSVSGICPILNSTYSMTANSFIMINLCYFLSLIY